MHARLVALLLALAVAGLLTQAGAARGQGPAGAVAQLTPRQYLPLLRDFSATVLFGAGADPETGEVRQPGAVFPAGITRLYVDVRLVGAAGSSFRTEAVFPDGVRSADVNRTAEGPLVFDRYYLCVTTDEACGSGEQPLPAGVYTVEVYVDDRLVRTAEAVLE